MQPLTTIHRVLAGDPVSDAFDSNQGNSRGSSTINNTGDDVRRISLLVNRQMVALTWGRMVVEMRVTDLLVLDRTLRTWMTGEDEEGNWSSIDRFDCTQPYILSLNERCILIKEQELFAFCALVAEAVEALPRRTVRWAELDVKLVPLADAASAPIAAPTTAPTTGIACLCCN